MLYFKSYQTWINVSFEQFHNFDSDSFVNERIENFLSQFERNLNDISESELQTRVESLIKLKQSPDVSLEEEVSRNWNEILSEEYLFDRLKQEVGNSIMLRFHFILMALFVLIVYLRFIIYLQLV